MFKYELSSLPFELLCEISSVNVESFRGMLCAPFFARNLTTNIIKEIKRKLTIIEYYENDQTCYMLNGLSHREDGPAVEYSNGDKEWYYHGLHHRDNDLPAVELSCGYKMWYLYGKKHRINNPAVIHPNGDEEWYINDWLHREDGPAVNHNLLKRWYKHGKLHRIDGPAVQFLNGKELWFIEGEQIGENQDESIEMYLQVYDTNRVLYY